MASSKMVVLNFGCCMWQADKLFDPVDYSTDEVQAEEEEMGG